MARWTDWHFKFLRDDYRLVNGKRRTPLGAFEMSLAGVAAGRWVRLGVFYGSAPGSHMMGRHLTVWRTRSFGMRGWNLRAGWWPSPCLTLLLHTREDPRKVSYV